MIQPAHRGADAALLPIGGCLLILGFEGKALTATEENTAAVSAVAANPRPGRRAQRTGCGTADASLDRAEAFAAGAFRRLPWRSPHWDRLGALYRDITRRAGQQARW